MRLTGALMLLVACGGAPPPGEGSPIAGPGGPTPEWVAVLATGDTEELQSLTESLVETAPDNVAVSPVACWPGLGEVLDRPSGDYAAAVVAPSRQQLDEVVRKIDGEPIHVGEYRAACVD